MSNSIERIKSRVVLTYPTDVEIVDPMESLLSGGYSSVHTRLGLNTEMFPPERAEYMKEKDEIIDHFRNLCGEKMKRAIRRNLTRGSMTYLNRRILTVVIRNSMTYLNRRILTVVTNLFIFYVWMGRRRVRNVEFSRKSSSLTKTISTASL